MTRFHGWDFTISIPIKFETCKHLILRNILNRDGSNLTSVLAQLAPDVKQDIEEYLSIIVPGIRGVEVEKITGKEMLAFRQDVVGDKHPWRFHINNISDGTLRLLGILVALFQVNHDTQKRAAHLWE